MRVVVDRDRCEGNAFCVKIAPEVFQLDDDEYAVVIADPVPAEQTALAEQAIAAARAAPSSGFAMSANGFRSRLGRPERGGAGLGMTISFVVDRFADLGTACRVRRWLIRSPAE